MKHRIAKRTALSLLSVFLFIAVISHTGIEAAAAAVTLDELLEEQEARKSLPIQSNEIENWPVGPAVGAESAVLLEANTGVILYAKNIHEKSYPASTTKLMTCLIAAENCQMDETVTFSHDAVFSIEKGSSNIGIDAGQSMPMEECLYGILVASANEVANAVAEHVAGSMDAFADMMNRKAEELGLQDTHFVNAHGLFDENHYTSAHDLAIIAQSFFANELLSKIGNTARHHFEATATQPDDFVERNKHQLINGDIPYEGIKGGKTGYTDQARQTLVTCAEKNGMKLICVVMKEESPEQFQDTVKLLDYGFANFSTANVSENETEYTIKSSNFFNTSYDVFGNSKPILSLNKDNYVILPKTVDFKDLTSEISYDTEGENEVAEIKYSYHNTYVGSATVDLAKENHASYNFDSGVSPDEKTTQASSKENVIFINVKIVLFVILGIAAVFILIVVIHAFVSSYAFLDSGRTRRRRRRNRKNRRNGPRFPKNKFNDFGL